MYVCDGCKGGYDGGIETNMKRIESNRTESYIQSAQTQTCALHSLFIYIHIYYIHIVLFYRVRTLLFSSVLSKPKWRKHSIFAACRFYPLGHFMCVYYYYYVCDGESARMKWQKCSSSNSCECVCVGGSEHTHNALCPKSDRHAQ